MSRSVYKIYNEKGNCESTFRTWKECVDWINNWENIKRRICDVRDENYIRGTWTIVKEAF